MSLIMAEAKGRRVLKGALTRGRPVVLDERAMKAFAASNGYVVARILARPRRANDLWCIEVVDRDTGEPRGFREVGLAISLGWYVRVANSRRVLALLMAERRVRALVAKP